ELGEWVGGEEVAVDTAQRRLLGDGLRSVLAELERAAVVGGGPGAAGEVEALLLVEPGQRERRSTHPHLLLRHLQRVVDARGAGGVRLAVADLEVGLTGVVSRCVLGHVPLLPAGWDDRSS